MIIPPPCLWIGAGESTASTRSPSDCCQKYMPTVPPAARVASHTRGPATSAALCSQNEGFMRFASHTPFDVMPCARGSSPVRNVACATHVTAGNADLPGAKESPAIFSAPRRSSSRNPSPAATTNNDFPRMANSIPKFTRDSGA